MTKIKKYIEEREQIFNEKLPNDHVGILLINLHRQTIEGLLEVVRGEVEGMKIEPEKWGVRPDSSSVISFNAGLSKVLDLLNNK